MTFINYQSYSDPSILKYKDVKSSGLKQYNKWLIIGSGGGTFPGNNKWDAMQNLLPAKWLR